MEKTKKKNAILRVAVVLFALTLISTGLLGGTLAKYVTSDNAANATARVAKWGVVITPDASSSLFSTTYKRHDDSYGTSGEDLTVSATTNVLAPGTSGTVAGFTVTGTPEVASRLSFTVDEATSGFTNWVDTYRPVKWTFTLDSADVVSDGTFDELVEALQSPENTFDFAPGNLSSISIPFEISWKWDFYTSEADDAKDTALGNLPDAPTITLNFGITITQID